MDGFGSVWGDHPDYLSLNSSSASGELHSPFLEIATVCFFIDVKFAFAACAQPIGTSLSDPIGAYVRAKKNDAAPHLLSVQVCSSVSPHC